MSVPRRTSTSLDIDLSFSVDSGDGAERLDGRVTAAGQDVRIHLSGADPLGVAGRPALSSLRAIGTGLAAQGLSVTVEDERGTIIRLGALAGTGAASRLLGAGRVVSVDLRRALSALLSRRGDAGPASTVGMPPATLWPLIPGLTRGPRPRPTTTHAAPGSGRPRLVFVVGSAEWDGTPAREFDLGEKTVIGSGPEADLRLDGLDPVHAVIRHDRDDEYRLVAPGSGGGTGAVLLDAAESRRNPGRILRTGARLELGPWRMAFFREEFADHGRPFGGRVGGEFAHQRPQPPRRTRE